MGEFDKKGETMKLQLSISTNQSINLFKVTFFVFVGLLFVIPSGSVFALCDLEGTVYIINEDSISHAIDTIEAHCGYVILLDSARTIIDSCCLDVNYDYYFYDLPDGDYTVIVMCAKRLTHTPPADPSCTDFRWEGGLNVTISGEPYKRGDIYI